MGKGDGGRGQLTEGGSSGRLAPTGHRAEPCYGDSWSHCSVTLERQLGYLSKASGAGRVGEGATELPGFLRIAMQAAKTRGSPRPMRAGGPALEARQAPSAMRKVKRPREVVRPHATGAQKRLL